MISKRTLFSGLLGRLVSFIALVGVTAVLAQQKAPAATGEKAKASPKVELFQNRPSSVGPRSQKNGRPTTSWKSSMLTGAPSTAVRRNPRTSPG